jgi:hypothetical protein
VIAVARFDLPTEVSYRRPLRLVRRLRDICAGFGLAGFLFDFRRLPSVAFAFLRAISSLRSGTPLQPVRGRRPHGFPA